MEESRVWGKSRLFQNQVSELTISLPLNIPNSFKSANSPTILSSPYQIHIVVAFNVGAKLFKKDSETKHHQMIEFALLPQRLEPTLKILAREHTLFCLLVVVVHCADIR